MELKEKDGKYYLVLVNGELEVSSEQAESLIKNRGAVIRNNLQNWIDNFYLKHWDVRKVPGSAEAFIRSSAFFDDLIRELEQICVANNYRKDILEKMLAFCNTQVEKLQAERENSIDIAFTDYHILCWQRVVIFMRAIAK